MVVSTAPSPEVVWGGANFTHLGLRKHEVEDNEGLDGVVEGEPVQDAARWEKSIG